MKHIITFSKQISSKLIIIALVFVAVSCKGPNKEKEAVAPEVVLAPLADSTFSHLDSIIRITASNGKFRMLSKIEKVGEVASYIGYDGRKDTIITDFSKPYEIGSNTKMFTATAILQLIEQGKFTLDTPFKELLPADTLYNGLAVVDGTDYIDSISVKNLLNHTSGMPDYFIVGSNAEEIEKNGDASLKFSVNDLISFSKKNTKARFVPDSKFEYSNINYIFLGQIIEKISGQSYTEYVQEHILNPLKMEHTYFGTSNPPADKVQGHYLGNNSEMPYTMAGAAGEIISTLDDMIRFIDGWYNGQLFEKKESREMVLNNFYNDMGGNMGLSYGLGCINIKDQSWGHAGGTFGMQAYSAALPNGYRYTMYIDEAEGGGIWMATIGFSDTLSQL